MGRNMRDNLAPMSWERQVFAIPNEGHHNCARLVLNATSFQPTQAYSSQSRFFPHSWLDLA